MAVYLAQLVSILLLWLIGKRRIMTWKKMKAEEISLFLVFSFLYLVMALRGVSVGTDTLGYSWVYKSIANASSFRSALSDSSIPSAPVYVFISYILSRLRCGYQVAIAVNSFIVIAGFYYCIKKYSKDFLFSTFLFVALCLYFESMNGNRQFMAIGLAINAYELIKTEKKPYKGIIIFLVAVGIHNTVVAFALAYIGIIIKNKAKKTERIICLSFLVSLIIAVGFTLIINVFVRFFPYFNIYLNGTNNAQLFQNSGNGRIAILYLSLGAIVFFVNYCLKRKKYQVILLSRSNLSMIESNNIDLFSCLLCILLGIIFSRNVLFTRILWPFLCVFIVYLPNACCLLWKKHRQIIYTMAVFILSIYCMWFLLEDKSDIVPYMLFWENTIANGTALQ